MKEKYINAGIKLLATFEIMLDAINELESCGYYRQKVKMTGTLFKKELEKDLVKFIGIAKNEESQKIFFEKVNKIEQFINKNMETDE